ncbi:DNA primase [Brunnivagina elsteri]|uniref:DNA primase n=1 Tax=Brunnivagina elsteri CCALA 953 TaxID=987040 RepID=A0A2A2TPA3_9CYAN|nr:DNA primase [Calothrix elsteri]PAX60262.1 DNA primase [Calothrix elsteri CCALA 953]
MQIPRLHPDTIEVVKERADIYDVVSEHVVLRKRGRDYVGLCPFHDEKSPSFTVSQTKQMYYCFGCQASGGSIKFLMELQKRSFSEVVLDLARRYQVTVQTLAPEQRQELQRQISLREQLYQVLAATAQFYQHALKNFSYGAHEYLREKRKLSDEVVQIFALGYAPGGWDTLYRYLVEDKHYPVQLVEKAGLIKPRKEGSGYYDVFRDRIMIPIRDVMGRVIAFGGRTMKDEQPKYLNSPETELFSKGKTLFALDAAKNGISQFDQAIVVEGYFDAIALHASGINNAVASLGTALSIEQVKLALRYSESKQLILNFDADKAGTNAAERAIGEIANLAYQGEVALRILNIPDGKDADEYLHTHSSEDYRQLLANAPLWIDWQIQQIVTKKDLKQATDYQQASQQIVKLLKNIVNKDTLTYYISNCAEILSLGNSQLIPLRIENLLTQISPAQTNSREREKPRFHNSNYDSKYTNSSYVDSNKEKSPLVSKTENSLLERAEGLLLRIYLNCPGQRQNIVNELEERDLQFSLSHHRFLWQSILEVTDLITDDNERDLVSRLQDICLEFPEESVSISHLFILTEKAKTEIMRSPQVVQATIARIEEVLCEKRIQYFSKLLQETDSQIESEKYDSCYQAFYREKTRQKELERQRQFTIIDLL